LISLAYSTGLQGFSTRSISYVFANVIANASNGDQVESQYYGVISKKVTEARRFQGEFKENYNSSKLPLLQASIHFWRKRLNLGLNVLRSLEILAVGREGDRPGGKEQINGDQDRSE